MKKISQCIEIYYINRLIRKYSWIYNHSKNYDEESKNKAISVLKLKNADIQIVLSILKKQIEGSGATRKELCNPKEAIEILAKLENQESIPILEDILKNEVKKNLWKEAIYALKQLNSISTIPLLINLLDEKELQRQILDYIENIDSLSSVIPYAKNILLKGGSESGIVKSINILSNDNSLETINLVLPYLDKNNDKIYESAITFICKQYPTVSFDIIKREVIKEKIKINKILSEIHNKITEREKQELGQIAIGFFINDSLAIYELEKAIETLNINKPNSIMLNSIYNQIVDFSVVWHKRALIEIYMSWVHDENDLIFSFYKKLKSNDVPTSVYDRVINKALKYHMEGYDFVIDYKPEITTEGETSLQTIGFNCNLNCEIKEMVTEWIKVQEEVLEVHRGIRLSR